VGEVDRFPALGLILRLGHAGAGALIVTVFVVGRRGLVWRSSIAALSFLLAVIFAPRAPALVEI
jgi:hypothetical protein